MLEGRAHHEKLDAIASAATPESAGEQTLGGRLIGDVRHLFSGGSSNALAAAAEARSNDNIAQIAADTVCMIPGVRLLSAGAIRATLLYDPKSDVAGNLPSLATNFAEGMALNGVTRLSGKLTAAQVFGARSMSGALLSQSVGYFGYGFGVGAVKSAFDSNTWRDQSGQLSVSGGLENVLKSGTAGGIIGIPAGFVGGAVGALGARASERAGLSTRLSTVFASAGSGYAAGAVFGGLDAINHGGSLKDILAAANESGVIGLAAGGATGIFVSPHAAVSEQTAPAAKAEPLSGNRGQAALTFELPQAAEAPSPWRAYEHARAQKVAETSQVYETAFDRYNIERPKHSIDESLAKLGEYKLAKATMPVQKPNSAELAADAASFAEYRSRAVAAQAHDVRVYDVQGNKLLIPEQYAQRLDEVLALRRQVEGQINWQDQSSEAAQAFEALKHHPLYDRAHPADLVWTLGELPDRGLAKSVVLVDWQNPDDPWHQKTYKPGFTSAATAGSDGVITFYRPRRNAFLEQVTHHEWSHLLKFADPRESAAFDLAYSLEKKYNVSDYAKRNEDENWAEHFETLTRPDPTAFFETVAQAPIRSAVMGRALLKALATVPKEQQSQFHNELGDRALYIQRMVVPQAQSQLAEILLRGETVQQQVTAARLLRELGGPAELELLKNVAKTSLVPEVQTAAFEAAREKIFYGNERWRGYTQRSYPDTKDQQIDFLVDMAQTGSRSRTQALEHLDGMLGRRASEYYKLLTLDQYPGSQMGRIFKIMQDMPDETGKFAAWQRGLSLAGKDADARVNLALATLERIPELRSQALDVIIMHAQPRTLPALEAVAKSRNAEWASKAKFGLERIRATEGINQWLSELERSDSQGRIRAIGELGKTKDVHAITPLLKAAASGKPVERAAAYSALRSNFGEAIVKFYARELIREDSRWRVGLQALLDHRVPPGSIVDISA